MNLTINQNNQIIEQVTFNLIDKLYNLSKGNTLDGTSYLRGRINAAVAYEDAITYLNTMWGPDLIVTAAAYYIRFADEHVKQALLNANLGDGIGITTTDAESFPIDNTFKNNTDIVTFDEFKHFDKANTNGTYNFYGCTNLQSIDLSNCTNFPNGSNAPGAFTDFACTNIIHWNGINSTIGELNIASGTESIGKCCFYGCSGIYKIILPDSIYSIGPNSFQGCANLTDVYFGNRAITFDGAAFYGDNALQHVIVKDLDMWASCTFIETSYADQSNPLFYAKHLYLNDLEHEVTSYTYPEGTT